MLEPGLPVVCFFMDNPFHLLFREATILEALPQSKVNSATYLVHIDKDRKDYNRVVCDKFILPKVYEVQYMVKKIATTLKSNSIICTKNVLFEIENVLGKTHPVYESAKHTFRRRRSTNSRKPKTNCLPPSNDQSDPQSPPMPEFPPKPESPLKPESSSSPPDHQLQLLDLVPPQLLSFVKSRIKKRYPRRSLRMCSSNVINIIEDYFVGVARALVNARDQREAAERMRLTKEFVSDLRDMFDFYGKDWVTPGEEFLLMSRQVGDILGRIRGETTQPEEMKTQRRSRVLTQERKNEVLDLLEGFEICGPQYLSEAPPSLGCGIEHLARLLCVFPKIIEEPCDEERFGWLCEFFSEFCQFLVDHEDMKSC